MGVDQNVLTWVGSGQIFVALVALAIFGLGLGNFPYKSQIFHYFPFQVTKDLIGSGQKVAGSASYLLRVKSILGLGWVRAHL